MTGGDIGERVVRLSTRAPSTCGRLRWNGLFLDVDPDPNIPSMSSGTVWCGRSQTCIGPDGQLVKRETCCPGRTCFEPG